ncbi:hypothetical protein BRADI_3g53010v3 [Brachypodium distachyon]|uniref:Uncharacterized protein n=1 Tax=Brachypodium distachyon TaxID=15368 RepID=I1ID36_BRADI|nr:hypothetical protein BRADI_3g53010v3 [Brachypodium distachyon]
MADDVAFAPPWMPSPSMLITPPAAPLQPGPPGYYQGSSAADATVPGPREDHGTGGSFGAFFAVLAAVLVLTALSCVFGRVCRAQAEGADELYDCARLARRWRWWRPRPRRVLRRDQPPKHPPVVGEALPPPPALPPLPEP